MLYTICIFIIIWNYIGSVCVFVCVSSNRQTAQNVCIYSNNSIIVIGPCVILNYTVCGMRACYYFDLLIGGQQIKKRATKSQQYNMTTTDYPPRYDESNFSSARQREN